eukprot:4676358-Amphidinium_carterae.2
MPQDKLRSRVKKGGTAARAQLDRLKRYLHHDRNITAVGSNDSNSTGAQPTAGEGGSTGDRRTQEQALHSHGELRSA